MTTPIVAVLPVLPGQADRVRNFANEIEEHREEFERLNTEATIRRFGVWLHPSPGGEVAVVLMEADDPSKIRPYVPGETPYDTWWLDFLKEVCGVDLRPLPPESWPTAPPPVYLWES